MNFTLNGIFRAYKITNCFSFGFNSHLFRLMENNLISAHVALPYKSKISVNKNFDCLFYETKEDISFWLNYQKPLRYDFAFIGQLEDIYFRLGLLLELSSRKSSIILMEGVGREFRKNLHGYYFLDKIEDGRRIGIYYRDLVFDVLNESSLS